MNIIFATHNQHKTEEVRLIAGNKFTVLNLHDIGCKEDIPETTNTLRGNALQKAQFVSDKYGFDCFADDTGLEIEALNGCPGVYSARYAGLECNFQNNMEKVLREMEGVENREACFITVISLILNEKQYFFEGRIHGVITTAPRGIHGFGYDPIFQPDGYLQTFAEMSDEEKNKISHRGIATEKLMQFLCN
jgi:XTP/dITP diphosphohydrolase